MFRLVRVLGLCWWFFGHILFCSPCPKINETNKNARLTGKNGQEVLTCLVTDHPSVSNDFFTFGMCLFDEDFLPQNHFDVILHENKSTKHWESKIIGFSPKTTF